MSAATNIPPTEPHDESVRVLGSLLYGGDSEPPVLEDEWLELVRAVAAGDQVALRELYERTNQIVFTLTFRILKEPLTTEEVVLDVYHDVWRRAATYDSSRASVVAWITNITRSRAIDRLRRENRKKRVPANLTNGDSGVLEPSGDELIVDEKRRVLSSALDTLRVDERRAIETAYFEGLSYAEVAERLNTPLGTIKTRIRTGLTKLRTLLQRREDV